MCALLVSMMTFVQYASLHLLRLLPFLEHINLPFLVPCCHYIVLDSSDNLDQRTRPIYICSYPHCWDLLGIKENREIEATNFLLNEDFLGLDTDFMGIQMSFL